MRRRAAACAVSSAGHRGDGQRRDHRNQRRMHRRLRQALRSDGEAVRARPERRELLLDRMHLASLPPRRGLRPRRRRVVDHRQCTGRSNVELFGERETFPTAVSVPEALHHFADSMGERRRRLPLLTNTAYRKGDHTCLSISAGDIPIARPADDSTSRATAR